MSPNRMRGLCNRCGHKLFNLYDDDEQYYCPSSKRVLWYGKRCEECDTFIPAPGTPKEKKELPVLPKEQMSLDNYRECGVDG